MIVSVSVIIPMYNVERHLKDSLNSLHFQKFSDVEFICVDDGSTDGTLDIAYGFSEIDSRFIVISQKNGGPAKARNVGIDASNGKYICFMDSDDFLEPDAIEVMYNLAEKNGCDVLVHSANIINMADRPVESWIEKELDVKNKKISNFNLCDLYSENGCRPFLWQHFIKSSIIKDNGLRLNENLSIAEDQAFEILYFSLSSVVLFTDLRLYNYRIHRPGSIMDIYSSKLRDKMWQHIEMLQYISNSCFPKNAKEEMILIDWALDMMYWDLMKLLYYDQYEYAIKLMDVLNKWNVSINECNLSQSSLQKYLVVSNIVLCSNDPKKLLDVTISQNTALFEEISRVESNILFRIGRKLIK